MSMFAITDSNFTRGRYRCCRMVVCGRVAGSSGSDRGFFFFFVSRNSHSVTVLGITILTTDTNTFFGEGKETRKKKNNVARINSL